MSGETKSRSKNKQEIKKLIKIYNIIKANNRKNKFTNNVNQHNKTNSVSNYYDFQTSENFYPQINQQNIYFESNISKNDRSLNSIDCEKSEIDYSIDEDYKNPFRYKTKYEKVNPKIPFLESQKTKNSPEKNINIEITQNFAPGGSININNCGNNNINNKEVLSKKFNEFSKPYISDNNIEKNINIIAKKTGRFGEIENNNFMNKDNIYKKISYKPNIEKNIISNSDNEITTITTKQTKINSFDHPPYTITYKNNTQKDISYEDHYGEENNNLVYSKKKFDCFSLSGERNSNYNNFLNKTESTLHNNKKNISIISIESQVNNIMPRDYNQSYNYCDIRNKYNNVDEYSCYVNQTLSITNYKYDGKGRREVVFPFYIGYGHKKSKSNDYNFGQIKFVEKENKNKFGEKKLEKIDY